MCSSHSEILWQADRRALSRRDVPEILEDLSAISRISCRLRTVRGSSYSCRSTSLTQISHQHYERSPSSCGAVSRSISPRAGGMTHPSPCVARHFSRRVPSAGVASHTFQRYSIVSRRDLFTQSIPTCRCILNPVDDPGLFQSLIDTSAHRSLVCRHQTSRVPCP